MCQIRYDKGEVEYGRFTFLDNPTITMALEEVADLANYARFTFIKLFLLSHQIRVAQANEIAMKPSGFMPTHDLMGGMSR